MSKGYTVAPWRIITGSGQSLAVGAAASSTFANAVGIGATAQAGQQTRAIYLSLAPTATPTGVLVTINHVGTASTATTDLLVKTTDPPLLLMVSPGDKVSCYGLAACTAYLTELTQ